MAYPTDRVLLFDRNCNPLRELSPNEVISRVRHEVINGEHTLTIETTRKLEVGWRALTVDSTGRWREWVVEEPDELHDHGLTATGTYRMVWSMQYDLSHTYDFSGNLGHREVGMSRSAGGVEAVGAAIVGTRRWAVGSCDVQPVEAGCGVVLIAKSAWDRLSDVVDAWGGEVDAEIEVGPNGVIARKVCLLDHVGKSTATRRFEWGHDLTSIRRKPDPGPYYCRIVPIGKGHTEYAEGNGTEEYDEFEYEWPLSLLDDPEYNPNITTEFIEDEEAAAVFRVSDGHGGWEYPTKVVKYDQDDVQLLYETALDDLHNHTRPNVTYEATVAQLYGAGMDVHGVGLGDEIQIIDRGFNPDAGLTIQERVTEVTVNELDDYATELVIGNKQESLVSRLAGVIGDMDNVAKEFDFISTDAYIKSLLNRINREINATGGYTYLVAGEGMLTFDKAVKDPLNPIEASQVVQVKGGSIRIANSRTTDGGWDWKTVFQSGHIVTELVTGGRIETGYIGNPENNCYWDIDGGVFRIGPKGEVAGRTIESLINGVWMKVSGVKVVTQWMQAETGVEMPNLYDEAWSVTPPSLKANMTLWKRDEVTLHSSLGTSIIYRNVETVYSSSNLLPNAESPTDNDFYLANAEVNSGGITLLSSLEEEDRFHAMWKTPHLKRSECNNCTFSLRYEARKTASDDAELLITYAIMDQEQAELGMFPEEIGARRGNYSPSHLLTTEFKKFGMNFTVPNDMLIDATQADPWGDESWLALDFSSRAAVYEQPNLLPNGDAPTNSDFYMWNAEVTDGEIWMLTSTLTGAGSAENHWNNTRVMWKSHNLTRTACGDRSFVLTFEARLSNRWTNQFTVGYGLVNESSMSGGMPTGGGYFVSEAISLSGHISPSAESDTVKYIDDEFRTYTLEFSIPTDYMWVDEDWLTVDFKTMYTKANSDIIIRNVKLVSAVEQEHPTNDVEIRNVVLENKSIGQFRNAGAQYYLSTSRFEPVGGEWLEECPEWDPDCFYWTRSRMSDDNGNMKFSEPNVIDISQEQTALERGQVLSDTIRNLSEGLTLTRSEMTMAIFDASRVATDYLTYRGGKLILGATDSAIRNVMTNSRNSFETNGTTVAYFGFDDASQLWQMFIANAQITDMLRFGDFAWIARQNGNMTLKWMGE